LEVKIGALKNVHFFLSLVETNFGVDETLISNNQQWFTVHQQHGTAKAPAMVELGVAVVAALVLVSGISGLMVGTRSVRFRLWRGWQCGRQEFLMPIASIRIGQGTAE
jgi:hypothetical protein